MKKLSSSLRIAYCALAFCIPSTPLLSQSSLEHFCATNGSVYSIAQSGNTIYLGGSFSSIMPTTGPGTFVDLATAEPDYQHPRVTGSSGNSVLAVVPDGSGGWYIAGKFSAVGGVLRNSLAHVLANNTVDPTWNPNLNATGSIEKMFMAGSKMYVCGAFTTIGGQPRNSIARIDLITGAADAWNPNSSAGVSAMVLEGNHMYVGGSFTTIGGQTRSRIACIDTVTGAATAWNPVSNFAVYELVMYNGTLIAGGIFTNIGTFARNQIAALDTATGIATSWDPNCTGSSPTPIIRALVLSGTTLYVGGTFTGIGSAVRNHLAALDVTTGLATSWNPNPNNWVHALALSGDTLYLGGDFTTISSQTRNYIASVSATTGAALAWNPNSSGLIRVLYPYGQGVYVGGTYVHIGVRPRQNLAAIDATTGYMLPWNPGANGIVHSIIPSGNRVFIAGGFTLLAGQSRHNLGVVDAVTGVLNANFTPTLSGPAYCLNLSGNKLYVGGGFAAGDKLLLLDTVLGDPDPAFTPNIAGGSVEAIEFSPNNSTLYVGGHFLTVNSQSQKYATAIDPTTGAIFPFNANLDLPVWSIEADWNTLYLAGDFTWINSIQRNSLMAVDPSTGAMMTSWDAGVNGAVVYDIELTGSCLYIAGDFTTVANGTINRNNIAAVDLVTGAPTPWNPNAPLPFMRALLVDYNTQRIYAGGDFTSICGVNSRRFFAAIDDSTTIIITGAAPVAINSPAQASCFPNPMSTTGELQFSLDQASTVSIEIYNAAGQLVKPILNNTPYAAGKYNYPVDITALPPGIYFCSIRSENSSSVVKLMVE